VANRAQQWFSFGFATVALLKNVAEARENLPVTSNVTHRPLVGLLFASAVVVGASISPCSPQSVCTSYRAFQVALGSVSVFLSLMLLALYGRIPAQALKSIAAFLGLWWIVGTGVVTFNTSAGGFQYAGNGYFACYAAIFFTFFFFKAAVNSAV